MHSDKNVMISHFTWLWSGNFSDIHIRMNTYMKYVFIALFMAFLQGFMFHENAYVFDERVLRLYNSNSQMEKNYMAMDFA